MSRRPVAYQIRVVIAEDQQITREGLRVILPGSHRRNHR